MKNHTVELILEAQDADAQGSMSKCARLLIKATASLVPGAGSVLAKVKPQITDPEIRLGISSRSIEHADEIELLRVLLQDLQLVTSISKQQVRAVYEAAGLAPPKEPVAKGKISEIVLTKANRKEVIERLNAVGIHVPADATTREVGAYLLKLQGEKVARGGVSSARKRIRL